MRRSQFLNSNGWALMLEGAKIGGSVFLRNGFKAEGAILLLNAAITGSFEGSNGKFINEKGQTLNLTNATVCGNLFLNDRFTSQGEVILNGATIKGAAYFSGGIFTGKGDRHQAISADSIVVEKYAVFGEGFQSEGSVWFRAAHVIGSLDIWGANLSYPGGPALNLTYAKIGSLHVYNRTKIHGMVSLLEATIETSLCWEDLESPELTTWDLRSARVKTLAAQPRSLPLSGDLQIGGLVFDELAEPAAPRVSAQLTWIQLQPSGRFTTQPYDQLAIVFRNMGLQEEATKMIIAKNKEHGHHAHGFKEFVWYNIFGPFIGFGYHPWNAFYLSIAIIMLGFLLFRAGYEAEIVTPTSKDAYESSELPGGKLTELYPRFNAFIYSLETFVPLLGLEMGKYWRPNPNRKEKAKIGHFSLPINGSRLTYYLWFHITIGWILTTLWLGGLTGLLKP